MLGKLVGNGDSTDGVVWWHMGELMGLMMTVLKSSRVQEFNGSGGDEENLLEFGKQWWWIDGY